MVDTKVSAKNFRGIFEGHMFFELSPNLIFNFLRSDKDEIIYVDCNLDIELLVIKEAGAAFDSVVAQTLHYFMQLFVPYCAALGVAVEGFFKDTDRVNIFGAAIGVKP